MRLCAVHSPRCAGISAEIETGTPQPMGAVGPLDATKRWASRVDVMADVTELSVEALLQFLHIPKDELEKLIEADVEAANEVMSLGLISWRPGCGDNTPLHLALGTGPGNAGQIAIKARPPGLRVRSLKPQPMMTEVLGIDLLANQLPDRADTDSLVEFGEDFRDVAVKRCIKLQHLALRLTANVMAGRGGG